MARTLTVECVDIQYDKTSANRIVRWVAHYRHANTDNAEDYRRGDTDQITASTYPTEAEVLAACWDDLQNSGPNTGREKPKFKGAYNNEVRTN